MSYALEQGPTEKGIIEQCVRTRQPLPDKIANAPELEIGLSLYYVAFSDLTTERCYAEGPIPWSAIRRWAIENELSGEQTEDLHYHIARMDEVVIKHHIKTVKKSTAEPTPQKKPRKK